MSSIVDLKAELFRKQEELREQKSSSADGKYIKGTTVKTKSNIWSKKNAGVLERAQRDLEVKGEEEDIFEKSKKSLQAKTQLYEKICKSSEIPGISNIRTSLSYFPFQPVVHNWFIKGCEDDGCSSYLVDFQKKVIDNIKEKKEKDKADNEEKKREEEISLREQSSSAEEQWVDYVDSLGRSRRCMKKDLSQLQRRDEELSCRNREIVDLSSTTSKSDVHHMMSGEARQELLQKWEKQKDETQNQPLHYSNVRFDEIRNHGVGYYQFSRSEETRHEEMKTLEKLREQTVDERSRRERLKEKRKSLLNTRLAKVKQRRTMKAGLLGLQGEQVDGSLQQETEEMSGQTEKKKEDVELLVRDDSLRKDYPVREWDKGKEPLPMFSVEKYAEDRRKERVEEFAPPSFYKNQPHKLSESRANDLTSKKASMEIKQDTRVTKITKPLQQSVDVSDIPLPADVSKTTSIDIPLPADKTTSIDIPLPADKTTSIDEVAAGFLLKSVSTDEVRQTLNEASSNPHSSTQVHYHPPKHSMCHPTIASISSVNSYSMPGYTSTTSSSSIALDSRLNSQSLPGYTSTPSSTAPDSRLNNHSLPGSYTPSYTSSSAAPDSRWNSHSLPGAYTACHTMTTSSFATADSNSLECFNQFLNPSESSLNITEDVNSRTQFCNYVSSTEPTHSTPMISESVLQEKVKYHTALSMNIVDERYIQNEVSDTDDVELPSVEAVEYEPGSYTEAMKLSRAGKQPVTAAREPDYTGGAVLYTRPVDSTSDNTTRDEIDKFLDDIKKETQKSPMSGM